MSAIALVMCALVFGPLLNGKLLNGNWCTDEDVVREAQKALASKDVEVRKTALRELALAALDADDAPNKKLGGWVARGLQDENSEVRAEALRLLLEGQHPDVVVNSLCDALDAARRELAKLGRGDLDPDAQQEQVLRRRYVNALLSGLGSLPDDRCVKKLVSFVDGLPQRSRQAFGPATSQALVALESRDGIEAVVRWLGELEAAGARRDRNARIAQALHEILSGVATAKQLDGAPAGGDAVASDWRRWFDRHKREFPVKLGKVKLERD